jgi:CRP/FNR family transcriptional regulator, cyclic AMP receptor protein
MPGAPIDVLRRVRLFADLDEPELEQVASLFKERDFPEGEVIIKEGSGGASFYIIEAGEATVTVKGDFRATLKEGDYFGEVALLDEGERMATVTAATRLDCYGLTLWEFRPLVERNGVIAWKLLQTLGHELRQVEGLVGELRSATKTA